MTYQEAAKAALECQNACNLSGVVRSFARATEAIWEECRASGHVGTDWVNKHPINRLFISKITHLNGNLDTLPGFETAYELCEKIAAGEKVDWK